MGLTLVTGLANSDKTEIVLGVAGRAVADGRHPVIIVPSAADARRLRSEFATLAPMGARISPAPNFLSDRWAILGDGRRIVTAAQRDLFARRTVGEGRLGPLVGSARSPGFTSFFSRLAARTAAYGPERLGGGGPMDRQLRELLTRYRDSLSRAGLVEPDEAWRLLGRMSVENDEPIIVHGFLDVGPGVEAFATSQARVSDTVVTLTWEEGRTATSALDPLVERLSEQACEHVVAGGQQGVTSRELASLDVLFATGSTSGFMDGDVRFGAAAGAEAEAELIAREAERLASDLGAGSVAVIVRTIDQTARLVASSLDGADVPYDVDGVEPARAAPLVKALLSLLRGVSDEGDAKSISSFLATPYSGIDRSAREDLDTRWRSDKKLPVGAVVEDAATADIRCGHMLRTARRLISAPSVPGVVVEWKRLLDSMMVCRWGVLQTTPGRELRRDSAAYRTVFAVAEALEESAIHGETGAGEVIEAIEHATLSEREVGRAGHVQIVEAHRLGSRRFGGVVIGGLDCRGFSADRAADVADEICGRLAPAERMSAQARERLLFYNAVTRATTRLVLVRQAADADGVPLRPSAFWDEVLDLYRDPSQGPEPPEAVNLASDGRTDPLKAAPSFAPGRRAAREAARLAVAGSRNHPAERGLLHDEDLLAGLASRDTFSATELETYARCPHRWFYERTVRPEALDAEVGPAQAGRLAHSVLRTLYAEALPERLGVRRVTDEVVEAALDLVDDVIDAELERPGAPAPSGLLEEDQIATIRARVRGLVMNDADFLIDMEPTAFEWEFGTEEPVSLGDFRLTGRVDRIDAGPNGIVVSDYKLGDPPKGVDIEKGRSLQVMLYALAAETVLGEPVLAGYYRGLRSGEDLKIEPKAVFARKGGDGLETAVTYLQAALEAAGSAVEGIRSGLIGATPANSASCAFCGAAASCPRNVT